MSANLGLGMRVSVPLQTQDSAVKFYSSKLSSIKFGMWSGLQPSYYCFSLFRFLYKQSREVCAIPVKQKEPQNRHQRRRLPHHRIDQRVIQNNIYNH